MVSINFKKTRKKTEKKITSVVAAICFMVSQSVPLLGEILPHNSVLVNKPEVNVHLGKQVPVVNIVAPNEKGLSHNKYDKFEVDSKGVVINNAAQDGAYSEILEESMQKNANFADVAASIILNEVVSGAGSIIGGAVEIAGQKADFILADPWGISVNGGRFINAGKVSLVAGVPNVADGVIKTFTIKSGGVDVGHGVESYGLDAGLSAVELIGRYVKIDGRITSENNIEVKTGNKEYGYETGAISSEETPLDAMPPAVLYAVDATAFGSMYGNRIKIVATEAGFGVKTVQGSGLVSNVEDIFIDSADKIEIGGEIKSKKDVELKAKENADILMSGKIEAGSTIIGEESTGGIKINADKDVTNMGLLSATGNIEAEAGKNVYNEGNLSAAGNIKVSALESVRNNGGKIKSDNDIAMMGKNITNEKNLVLAGEIAGNNVVIEAEESVVNRSAKITSLESMQIKANNIENVSSKEYGRSEITGDNISLEAEVIKNISADIKASGDLNIESDEIENSSVLFGYKYLDGSLLQGDNIVIDGKSSALAESIKNYASKIYAISSLVMETKFLENAAKLVPKASGQYYEIVTRNTGNAAEEGTILSSYQYGKARYEITAGGEIESGGDVLIKGNEVSNLSSSVKGAGEVEILADKVRNEVYSMDVLLKKVYDEYELYNVNEGKTILGVPLKEKWQLRKTDSYEVTEPAPLYASASLGSVISGNNINMYGLDGVSKMTSLNNVASAIKAAALLNISADKVENIGLSNINLEEQSGIKRTLVQTGAISPKYGYIIESYETADIEHTAAGAEISGADTTIDGRDILNLSSKIEGTSKLDISADKLTNMAIMFEEMLKTNFKITGRHKGTTSSGSNYDEHAERKYPMYTPYTFVSNTVGEIKGGDININLSGKLEQDKNEGSLQRAGIGTNPLYSTINGETVNIRAKEVENYGALESAGLLKIVTQGDFKNYDGKVHGLIDIDAGNDFISERIQSIHEFPWNGTFGYKKSFVNPYGIIMSIGDLDIHAGNDIKVIRTDLISMGDADIIAEKNVIFSSQKPLYEWRYDLHETYKDNSKDVLPEDDKGTLRVFGNLLLKAAGKSVIITAYNVYVSKSARIEAEEDIKYNPDEGKEKEEFQRKDEKWDGDESERITKVKITNVGSHVQVNGKLELIAGNNINVLASTLESLTDVVSMVAGMDVNVLAGEDYYSSTVVKMKSSTFGMDKDNSEKENSNTTAAASAITGAKGILISAKGKINEDEGGNKVGGNVKIEGSDLTAGKSGILITAGNNIEITTELEVEKTKDKKENSNTFTGGEIDVTTTKTGKHRGTNMKSEGNIVLVAEGDIDSYSANYTTDGKTQMAAGHTIDSEGVISKAKNEDGSVRKGNVSLYAIQNYETVDKYHKETGGFFDLIDPSNINIEFANGGMTASTSYKESVDKSTEEKRTAVINKIEAGGNIEISGTGDILSVGSDLMAGTDIEVSAGGDINLESAQNEYKKTTVHEDTNITVGLKVGNAYVDVALAADNLVKATENVARATDDLKKMEDLHKKGLASNDAVEDAKINLEMATLNMANATLSVAASVSGAASAGGSSMGTGMYASMFANYDTNRSTTEEQATQSTQGVLRAGGDITFTSGKDMKQEGTNVYASAGTLTYNITNDLTIQASKDTQRSESSGERISGGVSVGNNAVQISAGGGQSSSRAKSTTYNNSESIADNIVINAKNATLSGANVHATDALTVNVTNDLKVESLQNTYYAKGSSWDANVSAGVGTKDMGKFFGTGSDNSGNNSLGGGYSQSSNYADKAWVETQTTLSGGGSANINVGGKLTNVGSVIANADVIYDEKTGRVSGLENDKGNMTVSAKEFEYEDLKDRNVSESKGWGVNTSLGGKLTDRGALNLAPSGSTTVSKTDKGKVTEQTTKATLGAGTITVNGVTLSNEGAEGSALAGLNRDITKSQEITKDEITGALDASVTIDNRVLLGFLKNEAKDKEGNVIYEKDENGEVIRDNDGNPIAKTTSGWQSIGNDFTNFLPNLAQATAGAVSTAISPAMAIYSSAKAAKNDPAKGENPEKDNRSIFAAWKANQSANAIAISGGADEEIHRIQEKQDAGTATPDELQVLSNLLSMKGQQSAVYSQPGEKASAGGLVDAFNDLQGGGIFLNAGNAIATNSYLFYLTAIEENAHRYTSNEYIAKTAASNSMMYFNFVSWAAGYDTLSNNSYYGSTDRQKAWNALYNTATSDLLKKNTERANAVEEKDRAYSTTAYKLTNYVLGIKTETTDNAKGGFLADLLAWTLGTNDLAVERQDNAIFAGQNAMNEYAKMPGDIAAIGKAVAEIAVDTYENKEKALEAASDTGIASHLGKGLVNASANPEIWEAASDTGIASHFGSGIVYASVNPGETADKIGGTVDALLFGTIRTGLNNENLVYGMLQVWGGTLNTMAFVYGGATAVESVFAKSGQMSSLGALGRTATTADAEVFAQMRGSGLLNGTADFYVTPSGTAVPSMNKLTQLANTMGVTTAENSLVLWSGVDSKGVLNRVNAEAFAARTGKTTLEMTPTGQYFDMMDLFNKSGPYTEQEAVKIFSTVSRRTVENASGRIFVLDRDMNTFRPGSILNSIEIPAANKNPKITDILREGGY